MKLRTFAIISLIIFTLIACDTRERVKAPVQGQQLAAPPQHESSAHQVKIEEVIQSKSYTYLRVLEGDQEYWIATAKQPFEAGMTVAYNQGMEMHDFASKELDRTFDKIWFVGQMTGGPGSAPQGAAGISPYGNGQAPPSRDITVEKLSGGVTVEELYSSMSSFESKTVSIRGEVTKFNTRIMGRNWVHLQDGTSSGDYFDVTITTMAAVKAGDVVVFNGKVALNKDFGAGYKYDLIIEDAILVSEG